MSERQPGPAQELGPRQAALAVAVFVLIAAAYLASAPGVWFVHSDSACYLGLARSLSRGPWLSFNYEFNYRPFGKYPPVFPFLLSVVYRTLGENIWVMQALSALTGVGAVVMAFLIVRPRAGTWPALAVACLTATCSWFWAHSSVYILSGMPYTFFSLLALWFAEREIRSPRLSVLKWLLAALLVILAIYTHMSGAALVPAVAAAVLFARGQERGRRQRLAAAALVGVLCTAAAVAWLAHGWNLTAGSGYTTLAKEEPLKTYKEPFRKLGLRVREWPSTPLGLETEEFPTGLGLILLAAFVVPGLVWGFRRHGSVAEFYLCIFFVLVTIHGGSGGKERYAVPVVPLLFYFGYLSLLLYGSMAGRLLGLCREGRAASRRRLGRVVLAAIVIAWLGTALYRHKRGKGGAGAFKSSSSELKVRRLREWEAAIRWAEHFGPPDATLYPGPAGAWATLHFISGHPVGKLDPRYRGQRILKSMVTWDADLVLTNMEGRTRKGLLPVLQRYDCFTLLYHSRRMRLYRIDKQRLRQLVAAAETDAP